MSEQQVEQQLEQQPVQQQPELQKLGNSKEVIAYLAEKFPLCFSLEGEAKPLKIGIFQDLATALEGDERVSKTQLRQALRQYTSNWRYLHGCKLGAVRVDLDGNASGVLEQEHADHAAEQLQQAKAKVAERKAQMRAALKAKQADKNDKTENASKKTAAKKAQRRPAKVHVKHEKTTGDSNKVRKPELKLTPISVEGLQKGQAVKVKLAEKANSATVIEVMKDSVRVQLQSGMTLNVAFEHLYHAE
ncbi:RNA chaperone ProQ [Testudinibacter sp. P80/BLE/0925]|uniref:RNA chaperone ProQ n=1 Tax=Testudinibacter sp. TW-1 TaxID=3417757 RepID=UPI003D35E139